MLQLNKLIDWSPMESGEPSFIPEEIKPPKEKPFSSSEARAFERSKKSEAKAAKHKEIEADRQAAIEHIRGVLRTDRSARSYETFFGKEITRPQGMVLDLAAGDSNYAETVNQGGELKVIRCDYGYTSDPPKYKEGAVAGLAQELPFKDGQFEKVLASLLFEHIREKDAPKVISEMLRVTEDGGEIMIYPSYRALRKDYPFVQRKVLVADERKIYSLLQKKFFSTLIIEKNPFLTPEEWEKAIKDIARSVKMPGLLEKAERWWMKRRIRKTGSNKLHR